MPKIEVSEATIPQINWLVATLEGKSPYLRIPQKGLLQLVWLDDFNTARYATDWAQGGPIIEREGVPTYQVFSASGKMWRAGGQIAETLLVAAMRYYVASKLGDEVEVPKELL
jgi:formyltetrahydrofolate hydrolase